MKHDTLLNRYLKTQIHVYFLFGIFLLLPASLSASSGKERQISLLEKAEQELYTNPQLAVYYTLGAQDSIHSALGRLKHSTSMPKPRNF